MAKSRPQQPKPTSAPQKNQAPEKLSLTDRLRTFLGAETDPKTGKPRRVSRKQRDDRRTRNLYVALGVLGVVSVLLLSGAAINEYFLKPRKVLATVQGEDITRRDYWKYQSHSLASQAIQYQQFAMLMQGQQQQQYLAMAQQAQAQLDEVWGSTDVDDASLSRMVDDKVILASVDSLGLSISDEQVDDYIANQFAAAEAPVSTPTPSPTLIAERAEWATQTAIALEGSPVPIDELAEVGSPVAAAENEATPASDEGQRSESPVAVASPSSAGSPVPASSPVAGTPEPTATIGPQDARATSTANFENYRDDILELSHMSVSDYRRLVAEPNLAREMVNAYFLEELGQSAEQV
ncbi:MAG: SurA N-terminal domain-containing protein, partial [Thermomicrobiales bacterium]